MIRGKHAIAVLIVLSILALTPGGYAQSFPSGQTAADNARAGSVRLRDPGNMVNAGVAAAIDFSNNAQAPIEIVVTSLPTSIRAQLIADSLQIVFDELNQAIVLFHNLLLARAGKPPIIPIVTPVTVPPGDNNGGGGRR